MPSGQSDRIRFADTGVASGYGTDWTAAPIIDRHHSFYAQDRWSPSNRLSITAGVRIDYQKIYYNDAIRKPEIADVAPDGPIFPAQTTVTGATLVSNTDLAPRIGVSYNLSAKGQTVLKGFWGRYYNNLADGFSSANPGGTNYAEYNFLDQNRNNRYDGPSELGSLRLRIGGASSTVNPDLKTPHTDEISGSLEHQFWGESSARFTYVRKNQYDYVPFYFSPLLPAWLGQVTVPTRVVDGAETFTLLDVPSSIADQTNATFDNWPDGNFHYDTIEVAFNKRFSDRFFVQTSFDYIWRNELRSADISNWGSTSPLSTDPIGVGPQLTHQPERAEPAAVDDVPPADVGAVHVPGGCRGRTELPDAERLPVRPHHRRERQRDADAERVQLRVHVLRREHRPESIGTGEPDELPRRQGVHRSAGRSSRRCSTSTTCSTPIRSPTSTCSRTTTSA